MTRKIKSLKENECILIRTKREAKAIRKLADRKMHASYFVGKYLQGKGDSISFLSTPNETVLPASDFIKTRLKDRVKAISKQLDTITIAGKPFACTLIKTKYYLESLQVVDAEEVKPGLEVGWRKTEHGCLYYFTGEYNTDNHPLGYGFGVSGKWHDFHNTDGWEKGEPATHEEVSATLIEEAISRKLISDGHGCVYEEFGNVLYVNVADFGKHVLFERGIWAEIVEQPKEIDWSVPGQLVVNEKNYVWLTSGEHEGRNFAATYMRHGDGAAYKIGQNSRDCVKNMFKPFVGEIILSNAKH